RPPPAPSLFPYTTLFRSIAAGQLLAVEALCRLQGVEHRVDVAVAVALAGFARHFHAGRARQLLDRVQEFQAVVVDQEADRAAVRSEEHTSELQSRENLVC